MGQIGLRLAFFWPKMAVFWQIFSLVELRGTVPTPSRKIILPKKAQRNWGVPPLPLNRKNPLSSFWTASLTSDKLTLQGVGRWESLIIKAEVTAPLLNLVANMKWLCCASRKLKNSEIL